MCVDNGIINRNIMLINKVIWLDIQQQKKTCWIALKAPVVIIIIDKKYPKQFFFSNDFSFCLLVFCCCRCFVAFAESAAHDVMYGFFFGNVVYVRLILF